jgi:serine/threonine-protein kinase HipA
VYDLLQSQGSNTRDSRELFRRVVFSVLIHTDDHLRNHGFFIGQRGITLSPAFDINPSIERDELLLAVNEIDAACDGSIALDAHAHYGVSKREAEEIVARTKRAVAKWRHEADQLRIPKAEKDLMAPAFSVC